MSVIFHAESAKGVNFRKGFSLAGEELFWQGSNGGAVLLLHGLTGTPNEMRYLARFFHKQGYSVLTPRLANHGQPLAVLKKTRWQEFYASAREAFLRLESRHDRVFVSGLSMGALLSLLLAEEFPDKVSSVSCLSPTLFYDGWNSPWYRFLLPLGIYTPLRDFFYFKEEPPYGIKSEAIRKCVHAYYSKAGIDDIEEAAKHGYPYFPITLFHQLNLLIKYLVKRLPHIKTPTQLIQAEHDDMTSVKNSQFIYSRVRSPLKELVLLHNSYHVITADQERDLVAKKMDDFFNRTAGAGRRNG